MTLIHIYDNKKKPTLFTPFSILHMLFSVLLVYLLLFCYEFNTNYILIIIIIVFVVHTIYEIIDYYFSYINKAVVKEFSWKNNSLYNSIGDTICCVVGMFIALLICYSFNFFKILNKQNKLTNNKFKLQCILLITIFYYYQIYDDTYHKELILGIFYATL